ncbi:hypothetical protein V491_06985 [Pseudogymnoascus sp. VKM F-3775]|nr:hypothetical protein V491_06985 [Pseudogymnoascus sp. VKM F-3775]
MLEPVNLIVKAGASCYFATTAKSLAKGLLALILGPKTDSSHGIAVNRSPIPPKRLPAPRYVKFRSIISVTKGNIPANRLRHMLWAASADDAYWLPSDDGCVDGTYLHAIEIVDIAEGNSNAGELHVENGPGEGDPDGEPKDDGFPEQQFHWESETLPYD